MFISNIYIHIITAGFTKDQLEVKISDKKIFVIAVLSNEDEEFYSKRIDAIEENYQLALNYEITDDRFIEQLEKRNII